jgi:hypothetical protein
MHRGWLGQRLGRPFHVPCGLATVACGQAFGPADGARVTTWHFTTPCIGEGQQHRARPPSALVFDTVRIVNIMALKLPE